MRAMATLSALHRMDTPAPAAICSPPFGAVTTTSGDPAAGGSGCERVGCGADGGEGAEAGVNRPPLPWGTRSVLWVLVFGFVFGELLEMRKTTIALAPLIALTGAFWPQIRDWADHRWGQ